MPVRFDCPKCARMLEVAEDLAAKRVRCPACRAVVIAPAAAVQEIAPLPEPRRLHREHPPTSRRWPRWAVALVAAEWCAGLAILAYVGVVWSRHTAQNRKDAAVEHMIEEGECLARLGEVTEGLRTHRRVRGKWPEDLSLFQRNCVSGSKGIEYVVVRTMRGSEVWESRFLNCPAHGIRIEVSEPEETEESRLRRSQVFV